MEQSVTQDLLRYIIKQKVFFFQNLLKIQQLISLKCTYII